MGQDRYYLNYGQGFHSNDARGSTITVDPATGNPASRVPLLVRARGYEAGVRTALVPRLQSSLAVFRLDFDSELLFVGDAGTTEASRPSRRTGFELSNLYTPTSWLLLDADIAFTRALQRFRRRGQPHSRRSRRRRHVHRQRRERRALVRQRPCALFRAASTDRGQQRPLALDDARVDYRLDKHVRVRLDVFNLLNRRASQTDYFYESRLRDEPAPVSDVHFHPVESRSFRASVIAGF